MQKKTLSLFWKFSNPYKIQRFLALFFPVLAVTVNAIAAPYVLSLFLDKLQAGNITLANSWQLIVIYAVLIFVGEVIIWRLALYFTWSFEIKGQRDVYLALSDKLAREDISFHANRFGGSLVSQSSKMIGAFERFWDMIIWSIMPMVATVLGSIITLSVLGLWQYGIFLVLYSIVFGIVVLFGSRFLTQRNREEAAASTRNSGQLADMVTNIGTVKAFGREDHEYDNASKVVSDWHDKSTRLKWGVLGATTAFSSMYAIGATGAFIFAVLGAEYGIASAGMVYLVFIYALNINRQLWEFNNITRTYSRVIGDAHEATEILTSDYQLIDHSDILLHAHKGEVVFHNVSFTHDKGKGEQVFDNFNLSIPAGQRVGIVGHSGSGKTTLTRVLLRFSDIEKGTITIDDQDISKTTQQSLHESIAYVSQEPMLFHRSLHENIAYGRPEATRDEVISAAKQAHALEFIKKLPDGFETTVGERGVKLSGGQRQRIAIARAILKDAPILVLDEATSALDSESERLIQESLENLMKDRTSIVIAHRLSTIAKLDRIIVLEDGKIAEDGTHRELLEGNGIYALLWNHQSGGFIEE
ncbi:MAG TPA: ABC transporter ATP-binding protein [Candidatus Saccharimonadales bacterium]